MKLFLVRTGQTAWDAEGRVRGRVDVPLSDVGRAESRAAADALTDAAVAVVYAAPDEAARATAHVLAKALRVKTRSLDALADARFGLWEGMLWAEVEQRHPRAYRRLMDAPLTVTTPEGEPLRDAYRRVRAAIGQLAGRHDGETVAVVCSADVCRFVRACVEGVAAEPPRPLDADAPTWCALETRPNSRDL